MGGLIRYFAWFSVTFATTMSYDTYLSVAIWAIIFEPFLYNRLPFFYGLFILYFVKFIYIKKLARIRWKLLLMTLLHVVPCCSFHFFFLLQIFCVYPIISFQSLIFSYIILISTPYRVAKASYRSCYQDFYLKGYYFLNIEWW